MPDPEMPDTSGCGFWKALFDLGRIGRNDDEGLGGLLMDGDYAHLMGMEITDRDLVLVIDDVFKIAP